MLRRSRWVQIFLTCLRRGRRNGDTAQEKPEAILSIEAIIQQDPATAWASSKLCRGTLTKTSSSPLVTASNVFIVIAVLLQVSSAAAVDTVTRIPVPVYYML